MSKTLAPHKLTKKLSINSSKFCRSLTVAGLIISGIFQFVRPVLAEGTTAGGKISNTATAEYNYLNNLGVNILNQAASNTVELTVAEVAGITVSPQGVTDSTGGIVVANDLLYYDFLVTNVGNDPTRFFIPSQVTVTGPATTNSITADLDSNGTFETTIPNTGFTTGSILANGTVKVRVGVNVGAAVTSGTSISVRLGDTATNDGSVGTQNQPDNVDNVNANEVRTIDNLDGTAGETAGVPANNEREASATQATTIAINTVTSQAFATLTKVRANYTNSNTPNNLSDDRLSYNLSLKVADTAPLNSGGKTPADLVGTSIKVDSASPVSRILVSDAIPVGTHLASVATPPVGWTVVYTTDSTSINANDALWTTVQPTNINQVTRVGFIHSSAIATGANVTGFSFQVVTNNVSTAATTATIESIAQLFGQSAGDSSANLVYDESGDQSPSNYNDDGSLGSNLPSNGVANATLQGRDTNNDNTGMGTGGEVNLFTLVLASILNGPNLHPEAAGPTDNNDDFTNASALVPANTAPGSTIDPAPVTFLNTVSIPTSTLLNDVALVPVTPANPSDLPEGTKVYLTYSTTTAAYTYSNGRFTLDSALALKLPTLGLGVPINYQVVVDLPVGTALSTDTTKGFPVPIRAFIDSIGGPLGTGGNGVFDSGETYNDTIDRVYTGFLKLVKESRILKGSGPDVKLGNETFSAIGKTAAPGNIIEYRVTYTNISSPQSGSNNNSILNIGGILLREDGRAGSNNWARDNDNNAVVDTSHVFQAAKDPNGIVTYLDASVSIADALGVNVTTYIDTIAGPLQPGQAGTFTFQRKIN